MNAEFFEAIEAIEKEKGIPRGYMYDKIKQAMLAAFRKDNPECEDNVAIDLDEEKSRIEMYVTKTVVDEVEDPSHEINLEAAKKLSRRAKLGDTVNIPVETKKFGRIAAQQAKQIITQGIREAEKSNIIRDYERKREEVIAALVVKRDDKTGDVVVDTGTSNALLSKAEQIPGEDLYVGDRVKVFVSEVRREGESGPIVTISRTHPGLMKRLLETQIPEIEDGIVLVKGIAREAGSRTKVAVLSRDEDVDAVGACIGNRGMRIAEIVEELHGEKIDVIEYSENAEQYIAAALSPAKVKYVEFDGERSAKVIVDADQLSLAIGKEGQNVRLAAKLTGYKIDIKGPRA